jgi:hypothetical protein
MKAQGTLRNMELRCGFREAPSHDNTNEVPQLANIQRLSSITPPGRSMGVGVPSQRHLHTVLGPTLSRNAMG